MNILLPPELVSKRRSWTVVILVCVGVAVVIAGWALAVHFISTGGFTRAQDNMFGDQHLKTSVALIELHKVRYGKYPDSLSDLKFTGEWDQIALKSVAYYPNADRTAYFIEVERGWIGKPDLQMPAEFWQGTESMITPMTQTSLAAPFRWSDPHTWPWVVWVWLAFLAAGWLRPAWQWMQRRRAESWPTTAGTIESVSLGEAKRNFFSPTPARKAEPFVVELGYSYWAMGQSATGTYRRGFSSNEEAWEFQQDLKGKPIAIRYNPNKPAQSVLSESSLETLLQTRPQRAVSEYFASVGKLSLSPLARNFLWVFVILAAGGFAVSVWFHLSALAGRWSPPEEILAILNPGIFVVCIPAILVVSWKVDSSRQKEYLKIGLKGAPDWMRYLVDGFLVYAVLYLPFSWFQALNHSGSGASSWGARGASANSMAFYFTAFAILYTAVITANPERRCANGHFVPERANSCTICGKPVVPS